jgi:hypothetical protein
VVVIVSYAVCRKAGSIYRYLTLGISCAVLVFSSICSSWAQETLQPLKPTSNISTVAVAKWNPRQCGLSDEDAAGISFDLDVNVDASVNLMATVAHMEAAKNFNQLDCLADHYRTSKEKFSGGVWKLHTFYLALSQPVLYPAHPTEQDWLDHISILDGWMSSNPKSLTARVALASTYIDYAWAARGDGTSDSVTDSGWKLFEERVSRASDLLNSDSTVPAKDAEWYFAMLRIATTGQSWGVAEARAVFEQGYAFEPGYFYYGRQYRFYLEPKWEGKEGDNEKFSTEIADRLGGDEGDAYYFRLAVDGICDCQDSPKFDWARVVKGFKATEKLYGPSLIDMNEIAYLASYNYGDPVMADDVMQRIGDQWDKDKWKDGKTFRDTRDWAAKAAPMVTKVKAIAAEAEVNEKAPDGAVYKSAFEKKYKQIVQECVQSEGATADKFETYTSVSETGSVEDMKVYWNGQAAICIYSKLKTAKDAHSALFPKPPHGSYWIKLELDAGEFLASASK